MKKLMVIVALAAGVLFVLQHLSFQVSYFPPYSIGTPVPLAPRVDGMPAVAALTIYAQWDNKGDWYTFELGNAVKSP